MDEYISKPVRSKGILDILMKYCPDQGASINMDDEPLTPGSSNLAEEKNNLPVLNPGQLLDISDNDPELIIELIEEFLKDTPLYLKELQEAVNSGNQSGIAKKAHRLNGLIANCGGERLLEVGKEIEIGARQGRYDKEKNNLDLLETELNRLKQALSETDWKSLCK